MLTRRLPVSILSAPRSIVSSAPPSPAPDAREERASTRRNSAFTRAWSSRTLKGLVR